MLRAVVAILISQHVLGGDSGYGGSSGGELIGVSHSPAEFNPWVVSLERNGTHVCGGSIISERAVLSTASCTPGCNSSSLGVRVGGGGSLLQVAHVFRHEDHQPNASTNDTRNDLALIRLTEPMNFSASVGPIRIADAETAGGSFAYALGWSEPADGGQLQIWRAYVRILEPGSCGKSLSTQGSDCLSSNSSRLCSAQLCQGNQTLSDPGGSLVDQKMQLIGIITNTVDCTKPDAKAEYVKIFQHRDWIDEHKNMSIPQPDQNTTTAATTPKPEIASEPKPDQQNNLKQYVFIWKIFIFFIILLTTSMRFRIHQINDQ